MGESDFRVVKLHCLNNVIPYLQQCNYSVPHYRYSPTWHFHFITAIMSIAQDIFSGSLFYSVTVSGLLWEMQ